MEVQRQVHGRVYLPLIFTDMKYKFLQLAFLFPLLVGAAGVPQDTREVGHVPERIILTLTADPAHSVAVTWRTAEALSDAKVEIAPDSANPKDLRSNAREITALSRNIETGDGIAWYHEATLDQLEPARRYAYRVGDGETWSEWSPFTTAGKGSGPFRFLYLGDEQNHLRSLWCRSVRTAILNTQDIDFILHAGDLVQHAENDSEWRDWSYGLGFVSAMIPSLPVVGNHDYVVEKPAQGEEIRRVGWGFRAHFRLPLNGPADPAFEETAYVVDYRDARFVVVDTNRYKDPAQLEWLERVLTENTLPWLIVTQHHPPFNTVEGRNSSRILKTLVPIYEKHGVDLVLMGHDHTYARTHKIFNGKPVAPDQPGTVYCVSVSGPKMNSANADVSEIMAVTRGNTQLYQVIDVNGDTLDYRSYSIDGEPVDAFSLKHSGQSGNAILIEGMPQN
jgi:3',5'-cyclic AMP phosphodiesterase CpdA